MNKLAIITSHPIQYNAPLFRLLAQDGNFDVRVFYTLGKDSSSFTDPGFGKTIKWDIPLLEGYDYTFVKNTSSVPSTSSFKGIINPFLIQEIESYGATHLLVYGWSFYSHLKVIRHFYRKAKILFRGDSTLLDEKPGLKTIVRRLLLNWVYKHIDLALYVGSNNKQYFLKHGVPEQKLLFAPHAIDNNRFGSSEHRMMAKMLRQRAGIDPSKKVFLFTGKFEWKKNPELLIKAFNQCNDSETVLLMVGNGALEDEMIQLAQGNSNIKFLEFQNQSTMPAVYRLGDILVLPSMTETWGLSINEAMACGLPIIASDKVGGAPDLIDNGRNGYIFKSGNLEELTGVLDVFAKMSKDTIREMGRFSTRKIEGWNYRHTCDAVVNYINRD